jgi:hypothetical protein
MAGKLVLRPEVLGDDVDGVTRTLTRAFVEVREAVEAERPVVLVVDGGDLLGQGGVADAAVATGLLGMMRTFAIEGVKPGWSVNMVARRGDDEAAVDGAVELLAGSELSGQLLQAGVAHLGKVAP